MASSATARSRPSRATSSRSISSTPGARRFWTASSAAADRRQTRPSSNTNWNACLASRIEAREGEWPMKMLVAFVAGLIAAPILFVLAGVVGWLPSNATSDPPGWEMSLGMRALDASLEHRSAGLKNPIAANDADAYAAGQKLYTDDCAGCHGDSKSPSAWGSRGFYPRAPEFLQEGSDVTPEEAYAAVHDGIRYSGMGAWRDLMKEDDMWKVANFVAHVRAARPMSMKASR